MAESILWRRLDHPGHDIARLATSPEGWSLHGVAVVAYDGIPCALNYDIRCDHAWRTLSATIDGWVGDESIRTTITAEATGVWLQERVEIAAVRGCVDIDLAFTPATNLLPIRRLGLSPGQEAPVRAAWLRFPELTLEPLEQRYRRLSGGTYRYESNGGQFVRELEVSAPGFVTRYPGLWEAEARSEG